MKIGDTVVIMKYSNITYRSAIGVVASPETARRYIQFLTEETRKHVMCIVRLKVLK